MLDKRTEAQKQQQKLFQVLGTIARTRVNLLNLIDTGYFAIGECLDLNQAEVALAFMAKQVAIRMKNLPSKKNLKQPTKAE